MATSNTKGVFREVVGQRIVGFYEDDRPSEWAGAIYVLVFENGTGLAFGTGNGSHWSVTAEEVSRARSRLREDLERTQEALGDVLRAAGT